MNSEEILEQIQFEQLIQGLINDKYGCCNDFILPSTVIGLLANIQLLNEAGSLNPSGIGNKLKFQENKEIRGDKINWIEAPSTNQFEMIYLTKIDRFIKYLNSTCFTSIINFESHYALYEIKSFYKKHIDQFKNEKGRQYSIVLYLNDDWKEEDGGLLSLYPTGCAQINIAPLGGRMVFFKSDDMKHEVHASFTRDRRSIAGWLKN
jgi:SM-20-related protein